MPKRRIPGEGYKRRPDKLDPLDHGHLHRWLVTSKKGRRIRVCFLCHRTERL